MPNWVDVLGEIRHLHAAAEWMARSAVDDTRRKYLTQLHEYTGRHVIAYYSGWLSKPGFVGSDIGDEDKNGFMMAVHGLKNRKRRGLDLILHTPGGSIGATHSLVDYLRRMFGENIRAIVPQLAMSAGTMIACCCREILMARHSNLGPIDPHVRGLPAQGIIDEFRRACREVKRDPSKVPLWQAIVSQYEPTLLTRCDNAILWSNDFVAEQLRKVMFRDEPEAEKLAKKVVKTLADFRANRTHERHIHFDDCKKMGLRVSLIEDDQKLQDLVLTVHHCFMHSLTNTNSYKMIENHMGAAFVKQANMG